MKLYQFAISGMISIALLSGCGRKPVYDTGQFEPYVQKFEQVAAEQGQNIKVTDIVIKFGPMDNSLERGICEIDGDTTPTITINEDAWNQMSEDEREPLVFHELGHCVLHRAHVSTTMDGGVPSSLMNPYTLAGWTYEEYRVHYLKELFSVENTF